MSGRVSSARKRLLQHTAQQQVTLLQELLIDGRLVLRGQFVRRDHAADLVNGTGNPSAGNKTREVAVNESLAHTKGTAHALERETAVALQQLLVRLDAHLTHVVTGMRGQDGVGHQVRLLNVGQSNKEGSVAALVERLGHRG